MMLFHLFQGVQIPAAELQKPFTPHFISLSYFYKKVTVFDYNDKKEYAT